MTTMVCIFNIIDIEISKVDFINFNLCFFANLTNDTLFDTIINNIFSLSANVYEFKPLKYEEPKNDPPKSENFLSKYTTKETPFGVDKNMDPYSQDPISNKKKRLGVKEIVQGNNYSNKKIKKKSEGLIKFINSLKQRGTRGINSLKRTFEVSDKDNDGYINETELINLLTTLRIELNNKERKELFKEMDTNNDSNIDYNEFIDSILSEINEERISRLKQVFYVLDKTSSGYITLDALKDNFLYKKHPDVLKGKRSSEEIYAEFLDEIEYYFNLAKKNCEINTNKISFEVFLDFYRGISFCFEKDDNFIDILCRVWGINY